ncbi:MAG: hypothetical protein ACYC0X_33720 [Pirellulaceae bacterium]
MHGSSQPHPGAVAPQADNLAWDNLHTWALSNVACWFHVALMSSVGVVLLALVGSLDAATGEMLHLPQGNIKPKNALKLIIDTRWVDANGYRPVKITAVPWPAGVAVDRTIHVRLSPTYETTGRQMCRVSGDVFISAGATRGETTLAVPQCEDWGALHVEVSENREPLKDLCGTFSVNSQGGSRPNEAIPAILIIDTDAPTRDARETLFRQRALSGATSTSTPAAQLPDLRQLPGSFITANNNGSTGGPAYSAASTGPPDDVGTLFLLQSLPRVELLPPAELPLRWLDFSCFDMTFISAADLQTLVVQHPLAWQALRDWLATGPTLCVYDMKLASEDLRRLESLLELPSPGDEAQAAGVDGQWRAPDLKNADSDKVRALDNLASETSDPTFAGTTSDTQSPPIATLPEPAPPDDVPFLIHDVNYGRVVAMRTAEPLRGTRYELSWLLNELGSESWMWYERHGMSLRRENKDYWNWIVPGIEGTPVGTFLVLITFFVILIGPVNYFVLRRYRRLYLLLVTVPAGAALVTATLLAYALISDGLGVQVRVRGLIEVDQRTGRMTSWARQSYYAGLAPSQGLRFSERTAVYPIEQQPMARRDNSLPLHRLAWKDGQNLVAGYIASRSTAQLLVIDSRPTQAGLRLLEGGPELPSLQVTNQWPTTLDQLAVWDSAGRCFWGEDLQPGASASLAPIATNKASSALQSTVARQEPSYPAGYDPHYHANALGFGRSRYYYYYSWASDSDLPPPEFAMGILERGLRKAVRVDVSQKPEPRTYVALSHRSMGVLLGHRDVAEQASIYVIQGKW